MKKKKKKRYLISNQESFNDRIDRGKVSLGWRRVIQEKGRRCTFPRRLFPFLVPYSPDSIMSSLTAQSAQTPSIQPINLALNERALSYILRHRGPRRRDDYENEKDKTSPPPGYQILYIRLIE